MTPLTLPLPQIVARRSTWRCCPFFRNDICSLSSLPPPYSLAVLCDHDGMLLPLCVLYTVEGMQRVRLLSGMSRQEAPSICQKGSRGGHSNGPGAACSQQAGVSLPLTLNTAQFMVLKRNIPWNAYLTPTSVTPPLWCWGVRNQANRW